MDAFKWLRDYVITKRNKKNRKKEIGNDQCCDILRDLASNERHYLAIAIDDYLKETSVCHRPRCGGDLTPKIKCRNCKRNVRYNGRCEEIEKLIKVYFFRIGVPWDETEVILKTAHDRSDRRLLIDLRKYEEVHEHYWLDVLGISYFMSDMALGLDDGVEWETYCYFQRELSLLNDWDSASWNSIELNDTNSTESFLAMDAFKKASH